MYRKSLPAFILVALTFSDPAAHAGPMWGYRSPTNTTVQTAGEVAGVTFPNTPWLDATGDAAITVTPVQSWSIATAVRPDRVDGEFYLFGLELKDYHSGQAGTLEFGGLLTGDLWKDGTSLTNTFAGTATQALDLGLHRYTVTLDAFEPPTGFGEAGAGRITADVSVAALAETTVPPPEPAEPVSAVQTPEPGTLVLAAIGLCGAAVVRARKRGI